MKKILILGDGYIGNEMHDHLCLKYEVIKISRNQVDYHDKFKLMNLLKEIYPSVVIGAFGFTGKPNIDQAETAKEECWNLNVNVPLMVSSVCAFERFPYVHISSGCIFSGYEKIWTEKDHPNFGIFNDSSFYSKTKHAFELVSDHIPKTTIRIRMPFSSCMNDRNYITKLIKYDTLIDAINSRTSVEELCESFEYLFENGYFYIERNQLVHAVNPDPLSTKDFINELLKNGIENKKWNLIPYQDMIFKAPRSNCVINTSDVISNIFREEVTSLRETLKKIKQK